MGTSAFRTLVFVVLSSACGASPPAGADAHVTPDAGVDANLHVTPDADAEDAYLAIDAYVAIDANRSGCDCCGTFVETADGGSCVNGICDPWCGIADPCAGACNATQICVSRASVDAGRVSSCVARPSSCASLANCGGPSPDPTCNTSDPCFADLACNPMRVVRRGALVDCRAP